jgi:hypothetical protein
MTNKRKIAISLVASLVAYVGIYVILSAQGQWAGSQTGNLRYETGLSVSDMVEWRAKGCWFQAGFTNVSGEKTCRGNGLGYFFSPLILIDQNFVHKTQYLIAQQDTAPNPSGPVR